MSIAQIRSAPAPEIQVFDAEKLCRSWLTVGIAMQDFTEAPGYRQMLVEQYPSGFRLVSHCGYMMLTAFVPAEHAEDLPGRWPDVEEMPDETYLVSDIDRRGEALMKYAFRTVKPADAPEQSISIRLGSLPAEPGQFDSMSRRAFEIEFPAGKTVSESVALAVIDVDPFDWRSVVLKGPMMPTEEMRLSPTLVLKRLAALSNHWPTASVDLSFTGRSSVFQVSIPTEFSGIKVWGIAMPQHLEERSAS